MREIYIQIKADIQKGRPKARLQYTFEDFDRNIQIGRSINIIWEEDDENIAKMEDIASRPGFMFFNNSKEGMEFWSKNHIRKIPNEQRLN